MKGKDFEHNLLLKTDSTFVLQRKYIDTNPKCEGIWFYKSPNTILLKCTDNEELIEKLSTGYMSQRDNTIVIVTKNKLKLENVVLKRKKIRN